MQGTSSLVFDASLMGFRGTGSLTIGLSDPTLQFSAEGSLSAEADAYEFGEPSIPALESHGGDYQFFNYGIGDPSIPALYSEGVGGVFVPATLETGNASIKALYSHGLITTTIPGDGDTSIPSLQSYGGDRNYGFGSATLLSFVTQADQGLVDTLAPIYSMGYIVSGTEGAVDHILFLNSSGTIVDTITATREVIAELLGSLTASDSMSLIGEFAVELNSTIDGQGYAIATITGQPTLNTVARVWVMNVETGASSQYEGFGFNSYIERDGEYYGVAEDGIYKLEGADDEGVDIDALIEIGKSDFGSRQRKRVPNVYVAVSSTGRMHLKVVSDGKTYYYRARSHSDEVRNHRIDLGKGLRGNFYSLTLLNKDGDDFTLEDLSFTPVNLSRKI